MVFDLTTHCSHSDDQILVFVEQHDSREEAIKSVEERYEKDLFRPLLIEAEWI